MPATTEVRDIARSFLPEWYLKHQRDVWALKTKYQYEAAGGRSVRRRLEDMSDPDSWIPEVVEPLTVYRKEKYLEGIKVDGRSGSPFRAFDPQDPTVLIRQRKKDATLLHLENLKGAGNLRELLASAAAYIVTHECLSRTKYVAGATYSEMGRLALRFGFRPMQLESLDSEYETAIRYLHRGFNVVNGLRSEFIPVAIYMPTHEFLERYGTK